ncbi:MAG: molybdenum cofactor guanylyltransferase MobA [Rhodobacteraceae bacterium]|nr:molybdenum cofactor guanylyltransferase MobA [Paracoccaceae bacterium]
MDEPLGVVLAGGLSSRMGGGDKGLLELGGKSLMRRVIDRLASQVDKIALNANGEAERFAEFSLPVIADSIEGFAGPLAGVLAGMDWAADRGASHIVTVAADTPFFPPDLVEKLSVGAKQAGTPLAMAVTPDPQRGTSRHPTFGLWPVDLRDDLRAALNDGVRRVAQWTSAHGCAEIVFDAAPFDPFFNVNTPEDMVRAEQMLQEFAL